MGSHIRVDRFFTASRGCSQKIWAYQIDPIDLGTFEIGLTVGKTYNYNIHFYDQKSYKSVV